MKLEKGQIIYSAVLALVVLLLLLPSSTSFFNMTINELSISEWDMWLPDLLGLMTILVGYIVLAIFYKKHSRYRKRYPFLVLLIGLLWTIAIQLR